MNFGEALTGLKAGKAMAPKNCVPWLASQTDMFAEDWEVKEGY